MNILPGALVRTKILSLCTHMHTYSVEEMRELLLEHGATNTRKLQEDHRSWKSAVENEPTRLKHFHEDPRVSY